MISAASCVRFNSRRTLADIKDDPASDSHSERTSGGISHESRLERDVVSTTFARFARCSTLECTGPAVWLVAWETTSTSGAVLVARGVKICDECHDVLDEARAGLLGEFGIRVVVEPLAASC